MRLWEDKAKQFGADRQRVQVWDTLADTFLDTSFDDQQLAAMADTIAQSPFSFEELGHILYYEVTPVCWSNLYVLPGGVWSGFSPDWLIPRCLKQQRKHRFVSSGHPDELPILLHAMAVGPACDGYLLLYRALRVRTGG